MRFMVPHGSLPGQFRAKQQSYDCRLQLHQRPHRAGLLGLFKQFIKQHVELPQHCSATQPHVLELLSALPSHKTARAIYFKVEHLPGVSKADKERMYGLQPDTYVVPDDWKKTSHPKHRSETKPVDFWRAMLDNYSIAEVEDLLAQGIKGNSSAASAIGYRETIAYLDGELKHDELLPSIVQNTMLLVKKQSTWFRTQIRRPDKTVNF